MYRRINICTYIWQAWQCTLESEIELFSNNQRKPKAFKVIRYFLGLERILKGVNRSLHEVSSSYKVKNAELETSVVFMIINVK